MRSLLVSSLAGVLALSDAGASRAAQAPAAVSYDALFAEDASGRGPDQPAWSPDGRRLTYLLDDGSKGPKGQNPVLWLLDPGRGTREELLHPAELAKAAGVKPDNPENAADATIDAYQWSPRGDILLLESGGDLYSFALQGRALHRLTKTTAEEKSPKVSPDGSRVAFVREANLYVLDLASGREQALTTDGKENEILEGTTDWVYWEEIWDRLAAGFWWSPDSRRIAYYRFDDREVPTHPLVDASPRQPKVTWQRYPQPGDPNPKVRLGVLELSTGRTVWMDTAMGTAMGSENSEQYLARVTWTPDGGALAIQALARSQTRLDLLRCGAGDGRCTALASETWPTWVNLADDFRFLPDGRFLWGSEKDGWRRLFLYDRDGRLVRQVSPDGWVVASVDRVPEAGDKDSWVIFTGYRTEGLEAIDRHVLRASLVESRSEVLTPEPGTHSALVAPHTGHWVHAWSTVDAPERSEARLDGGEIVPLPYTPPSTYDPAALPKARFFTIPGPEGTALPARLLEPAGFDPGRRYPVIVYQYGGPGSQTVVNRWDRRRRELFHKRMAQLGFAVLTVDGRSTAFFGKKGEDLDYRRLGENNLAAQLAAVEYLKTQPWADTGRLGLWGWSGGGSNTLYCLLSRPGVWKAGVAGAPVTDWRLYDSIWTERYFDTPEENEAGYRESSPVSLADRLQDRLLIVHGLADDNVHPQNTVNMVDKLVRAGRPVEQAFYPGEKHAMKAPAIRHFFERMEEFWVRTLEGEIGD
jgi:dipeptidyl-peptidase-4